MPTTLTHCPECGVPFNGRNARDPKKHYHAHYPSYDRIPADPEHYLARKRALMLLTNDANAEPSGHSAPTPVSVGRQEEPNKEEDY